MIRFLKPLLYLIIKILPSLKLNSLKALLYNMMGYNIDDNVIIASSAKILGAIDLKVGKGTFIGHEAMIIGGKSKIIIGSNVDISSRVNIISGTHKIDMNRQRSAGEGIGADIIIEDGVWIGFSCIIMPGVRIGYKSIIGAGSIVTKDIPPYSIAVGNPSRVIKKYDVVKKVWVKL